MFLRVNCTYTWCTFALQLLFLLKLVAEASQQLVDVLLVRFNGLYVIGIIAHSFVCQIRLQAPLLPTQERTLMVAPRTPVTGGIWHFTRVLELN